MIRKLIHRIQLIPSSLLATSILAVFFLTTTSSYSQALLVGGAGVCPGESAVISLIGDDLEGIGSMTLLLTYSPDSMVFDSVEFINSQLMNASFNHYIDASGGHLAFAWSSLSYVNFYIEDLISFRFSLLASAGTIQFQPNTEMTDGSGNILAVNYFPGQLSLLSQAEIVSSPFSNYLFTGYLELEIEAVNTHEFQWQLFQNQQWTSLDDNSMFEGTHSGILKIYSLPDLTNIQVFRCRLVTCDTVWSDEISVEQEISIAEPVIIPSEWKLLPATPNSWHLIPPVNMSDNSCLIKVISLVGNEVESIICSGETLINLDYLTSGLYQLCVQKMKNPEILYHEKIIVLH